MTDSAVELQDLAVAYGSETIFTGIDISISEGEFVSFLGPSGCGKSTILRIIGELATPRAGTVSIHGEDAGRAWQHLAYVFQAPRLVPWRNALHNVVLGMQLRGVPGSKAQLRDRAMSAMETIGIGHLADRPAHVLSGGEQQRVAIARALAVEPRVLLMDEPFSALDVQTRHQLRDEIVALWKRTGITTVFVTHDVDEAILVSSRIVVFSAKPTVILADRQVELADHRDPASEEFQNLRAELVRQFHGVERDEILGAH